MTEASTFAGEDVFGSFSNDITLNNIVLRILKYDNNNNNNKPFLK